MTDMKKSKGRNKQKAVIITTNLFLLINEACAQISSILFFEKSQTLNI